ncbi:FadR/GntR family transcriptional regulator [Mycolicibacterium goodii]|uniref:FadR/GntR family transcriptional regulator n=1 Tax=Mycolicibacterium goodii TaxID=134601 RepID=UPI001BDC08AA|nr:FadR/GntR family transcriptional regulator [Mycolicibacterium goodii]MBU8828911.1 FadR family transcriptional regulator [Mycolicibacterium goodii]
MSASLTDPPFQPVESILSEIAVDAGQAGELKSQRVVAAFERQILSGRLASGTRLPTEGELCELLGVSRSVIRDSIRTLMARGLVTVRQGRGTTVAEPSDTAYSNAMLVLLTRSGMTMGDVFNARATIDISLVALAAKNGTADDWDALDEAYKRFADAVARDDEEAATLWHARFHMGILTAVHQPALTLMLRPMTDLTVVSGTASVRRTLGGDWEVEGHAPILAALKAGDPDKATAAMVAHYEVATRPEPYQTFMDRLFADAYFNDEVGVGVDSRNWL